MGIYVILALLRVKTTHNVFMLHTFLQTTLNKEIHTCHKIGVHMLWQERYQNCNEIVLGPCSDLNLDFEWRTIIQIFAEKALNTE